MARRHLNRIRKRSLFSKLTISDFERLTRSLMALIIGFSLTSLFILVILGALRVATAGENGVNTDLLSTILTLAATGLGAVLGFVFGSNSSFRR